MSAAQFGSVITPFAGTDTEGDSGDGGPAFKAQIGSFARLGTGPDGSLYVASATHIRRIGPDGIIQTIAFWRGSFTDIFC